jgi:hypothetical protein
MGFDLDRQDRLRMKLANSDVDPRVFVCVREFLVGRTQRVRVAGQLSKGVKVTSGVPQWKVLCQLLFVVYINYIWRNIDWKLRLFADECIM